MMNAYMEIIDINNNSEIVNFIESTKEAQNEINKSVIKIICDILSENGEITYEEKRNIINNATMRIMKS